jgi:hypothetical protein
MVFFVGVALRFIILVAQRCCSLHQISWFKNLQHFDNDLFTLGALICVAWDVWLHVCSRTRARSWIFLSFKVINSDEKVRMYGASLCSTVATVIVAGEQLDRRTVGNRTASYPCPCSLVRKLKFSICSDVNWYAKFDGGETFIVWYNFDLLVSIMLHCQVWFVSTVVWM